MSVDSGNYHDDENDYNDHDYDDNNDDGKRIIKTVSNDDDDNDDEKSNSDFMHLKSLTKKTLHNLKLNKVWLIVNFRLFRSLPRACFQK